MLRPARLLLVCLLAAACSQAPVGPTSSPAGSPVPVGSTPGDGPLRPTAAPSATAAGFALLGPLPATALDAPTAGRLQAVLDDLVPVTAPAAFGSVVTVDGRWAGAAGIAGPDARPATTADAFSVGSISQIVLAATVLRLSEEGTLDLDAPLARYLQGVDVDTNGATIRDALGFRTGIGDTLPGSLERAALECREPWDRARIAATFPEPHTAAGTAYTFSNPTYKLLGWAVEDATGMPLAEAIQVTVLNEQERDRLIYQSPGFTPLKPWALPLDGHTGILDLASIGAGDALPCQSIASLAAGAGGIATDAPTLAGWLWRLFAGDVISPDSLREMTTMSGGHGLSINALSEFRTDAAIGRLGNLPGYGAVVAVVPERGIVAVLFLGDATRIEAEQVRALAIAAGL